MSEQEEMRLPPGKTCADCVAVRRCVAFGFSWPARTMCDFHPSRYEARAAPAQPKEAK